MTQAATLPALESVLKLIDTRVDARHLLKHPFYQAWNAGTLSREALRDYAAQYYHHVAAFPTYLSAVHSQTGDLAVRRHILTNLMDEEAGSPNHPELWMTFAESLGLTRQEVEQTELWPETASLISRFRGACRDNGTAAGLAALYAYESQVPAVAETKINGLKKFYGFDDAAGYEYFRVHIEADKEHSAMERELLGASLRDSDTPAVLHGVDEVLDGLSELLSGVCRRHAISN